MKNFFKEVANTVAFVDKVIGSIVFSAFLITLLYYKHNNDEYKNKLEELGIEPEKKYIQIIENYGRKDNGELSPTNPTIYISPDGIHFPQEEGNYEYLQNLAITLKLCTDSSTEDEETSLCFYKNDNENFILGGILGMDYSACPNGFHSEEKIQECLDSFGTYNDVPLIPVVSSLDEKEQGKCDKKLPKIVKKVFKDACPYIKKFPKSPFGRAGMPCDGKTGFFTKRGRMEKRLCKSEGRWNLNIVFND